MDTPASVPALAPGAPGPGSSAAADPSLDLYHDAHKPLRAALFSVTVRAGRTDPDDGAAVAGLLAEWKEVAGQLAAHHQAEDEVCAALVAAHAPELLDGLEADHDTCDDLVDQLERRVAALAAAPHGQRYAPVRRLYLELCMLCSRYLDHLAYEEDQVMPALFATMSAPQLAAARQELRSSIDRAATGR